MSAPELPQNDDRPERRARKLADQAAPYKWSYDTFEGIAASEGVPKPDHPDLVWLVQVAEVLGEILVNAEAVNRKVSKIDSDVTSSSELLHLVKAAGSGGIKAALEHLENFVLGAELTHVPVDSITEYEELFQTLALPPVAHNYTDDGVFARMRTAGPNPMTLRGVSELPDNFPVTDAQLQRALEHYRAAGRLPGADTLEAALAEGRAFLCDYKALEGAPVGSFPRPPKHLYAPLGLFITTSSTRDLLPVAIQCGQTPGDAFPMFTPADGEAWLSAKTAFTVADGNIHQAISHLAHTHLVTGPFRVAAKRTLAPSHPIACLLDPHGEGTLNINDAANSALMKPKGGVDALLGGPIEYSRQVAIDAVKTWDFQGSMLHNDLNARGLMSRERLPDMPYRDDALLVHGALREWVEAFVRTYYVRDADVLDDTELQSFWREVGAQDGGRIRGLGQMRSVDYLIDAVTHIIFTGSAQHAAVNFPQHDMMAYLPNFPLTGFTPAPTSTAVTTQDYLSMLPWLDLAQYQSALGTLLGGVHHTKLGHYKVVPLIGSFAGDRRLNKPLEQLQRSLDVIEDTIADRNRSRSPYEYLRPSKIPQSINI